MKSALNMINPTIRGSSSPSIPQPFIHSAASATAELVSCFILTPAEVLKQNAQMMQRPAESPTSKSSKLFQRSVTLQTLRQFKRPSQLWRGYTALAARNLPFTAMQFPMFEHLKASIREYRKKKGTFTPGLAETALTTAISAGSAGSIAAVVTTPIDIVKTRIMLSATGEISEHQAKKELEKTKHQGQSAEKLASEKRVTKKSALTVARDIFRENGMKGLFRGGMLRAAWTALGSGLYLSAYESGRVWLGDKREGDDDI
jgi:solute carrier family 25 S-adenosylmethionine transporter 26